MGLLWEDLWEILGEEFQVIYRHLWEEFQVISGEIIRNYLPPCGTAELFRGLMRAQHKAISHGRKISISNRKTMDFPSGGIVSLSWPFRTSWLYWKKGTLMIPNDGIIEINYAHKKPNNMGRLWRAPYNWITGFHHPSSIVNEKVKTTNQLQDRPVQLTPSSRVFPNISQGWFYPLAIWWSRDFCWSSEA